MNGSTFLNNPVFGHIELEILVRLLNKKSLRFSELMMVNVPSDVFNYHLKKLVQQKYIEKIDEGYRLTEKGIVLFEEQLPITTTGAQAGLFKIRVLIIIKRINKNGKLEILLQKRKRFPFYGEAGIIGGSIKKQELMLDAAKRVLKQETGLEGTLSHKGIIRKIRMKGGELFSDSIFHVFICEDINGELTPVLDYGINFWADVKSAIKAESEATQGSKTIVGIIKDLIKAKVGNHHSGFFYKEEIVLLK